MKASEFIKTIKDFHADNRRDLDWRRNITPYSIFVSEIMLQQTQVTRVAQKFPVFIETFPDFKSLARAAVADVLVAWQGMGYNRRALYLKKSAEIITYTYKEYLPDDPAVLETLPGIGHATSRSIVTFAYNKPEVFIETNIRRVFIHFFFGDNEIVSDKQIIPLVEATLDRNSPREWYYALMDYGTILAKTVSNPNRRSKHYTKQSAFEGSTRQIRGHVLKILLEHKHATKKQLNSYIQDERLDDVLQRLVNEGMVREKESTYSLG